MWQQIKNVSFFLLLDQKKNRKKRKPTHEVHAFSYPTYVPCFHQIPIVKPPIWPPVFYYFFCVCVCVCLKLKKKQKKTRQQKRRNKMNSFQTNRLKFAVNIKHNAICWRVICCCPHQTAPKIYNVLLLVFVLSYLTSIVT